MKELLEQLTLIDDRDELEIAWTILRRQDKKCGILKKLRMFAVLMGLDPDKVLESAEQDESGRILDKPNRDAISNALQQAQV